MSLSKNYKNSAKNISPFRETLDKLTALTSTTILALSFGNIVLDQVSDPDLTPIDMYMQNNNMPPGLLDGLKPDKIFVLEPDNYMASLYALNRSTSDISPLLYPVAAANLFKALSLSEHSIARNIPAGGTCNIIPPVRDGVEKFLKGDWESNERDFELNVEDIKHDIKTFIILHEIMHSYGKKYRQEQGEFCDKKISEVFMQGSQSILSTEIMGDFGALQIMKENGYDVEQLVLAIRARDALLSWNHSHSTAPYLEPLLKNVPEKQLPDLDRHKEDLSALYNRINESMDKYSSYSSIAARNYMAVHDVLESSEDMTPRMTIMAEQYKDAYEYLAPQRASDLRQQRTLFLSTKAEPEPDLAQEPMI